MVDIAHETTLFTPPNVSRFARNKAKLLYAILGEALPNTDKEHVTIGLALTPEEAFALCEESMGDAIEIWVIEGERSLLSEKWEPKYFKEHFDEVVEYTIPDQLSSDDDESASPVEVPEELKGMGIEMPPEVIMGKSLLEILEFEQLISKAVAATSYMTGHPVDINALVDTLHGAVADIVGAFVQSKGGFEPKFHKKDGILVPYWTKTQVRQARMTKSKK